MWSLSPFTILPYDLEILTTNQYIKNMDVVNVSCWAENICAPETSNKAGSLISPPWSFSSFLDIRRA